MPPSATATLLSPAELSYLHTSLSLDPPARPDGRSATQFRPLIAETDILPGTNGSARMCFADGTEAIVGVKAEVERATETSQVVYMNDEEEKKEDTKMAGSESKELGKEGMGSSSWVEMSIEIPGYRDDDSLPVFLAAMLSEALTSSGDLADKLYINTRFHWRIYLDVLLLSAPLSYPVPLLSLTVHLALLSTRLPKLISEGEEDPLFSDDWGAAPPLYPMTASLRPPITLLVVAVGSNIIFDPSKEEIAVADTMLGVSLSASASREGSERLSLIGIRTIDPPARTTTPGIADSVNSATSMATEVLARNVDKKSGEDLEGVWMPPRGGFKRNLIPRVISMCLGENGVGSEVLAGLDELISSGA